MSTNCANISKNKTAKSYGTLYINILTNKFNFDKSCFLVYKVNIDI